MLIKTKNNIPSSEITDQSVFLTRRKIIKAAAGMSLVAAGGSLLPGVALAKTQAKLYSAIPIGPYSASLETTDVEYVKTYTNYYEFTTGKEDSTQLAQALTINPWNVRVEGNGVRNNR